MEHIWMMKLVVIHSFLSSNNSLSLNSLINTGIPFYSVGSDNEHNWWLIECRGCQKIIILFVVVNILTFIRLFWKNIFVHVVLLKTKRMDLSDFFDVCCGSFGGVVWNSNYVGVALSKGQRVPFKKNMLNFSIKKYLKHLILFI